jgi:hypothetical protein
VIGKNDDPAKWFLLLQGHYSGKQEPLEKAKECIPDEGKSQGDDPDEIAGLANHSDDNNAGRDQEGEVDKDTLRA